MPTSVGTERGVRVLLHCVNYSTAILCQHQLGRLIPGDTVSRSMMIRKRWKENSRRMSDETEVANVGIHSLTGSTGANIRGGVIMPSESGGSPSTSRWLIGTIIAVLGAGGGIVALLNYIHPQQTTDAPKPDPRGNSVVSATCSVSGLVLNDAPNYPPLGAVKISYLPKDGKEPTYLTTTAPDGTFKSTCTDVDPQKFPLKLQLSRAGWVRPSDTEEHINREERAGINVYVREADLRAATSGSPVKAIVGPPPIEFRKLPFDRNRVMNDAEVMKHKRKIHNKRARDAPTHSSFVR